MRSIASFMPRRIRLLSGLVLFAYTTLHLVNHALGIVSLALAESGLRLALAFWRIPVVTGVLYGAAAIHFALALRTLYIRREWRLPLIEILRLASGFSLPMILIGHVVATRLADTLFGVGPTYAAVIAKLQMSGTEGLQLALLAPGWVHGCLGLWITLRRHAAMRRLKPVLVAALILLPSLAAMGFLRMEAEVSVSHALTRNVVLGATEAANLAAWKGDLTIGYCAMVLLALVLGWLRRFPELRRKPSSSDPR
jgi:adenylate cyclase